MRRMPQCRWPSIHRAEPGAIRAVKRPITVLLWAMRGMLLLPAQRVDLAISGPVPDSNHGVRGETSRIRDLERKIEELDHREKQTERFLKRQNADYIPEPYKPSTYLEEEVPARRKQMSIESDSANPNNFQTPINRGRTAPSNLPTEEENRKPVLSIPGQGEGGTSIQNHDANGSFKETEPQALQIERRLTSRAIVPRERMQIVTKQNKLSAVAKTPQRPAATIETSRPAELARN
jgi:hypothetical protein